jgi:kinesin family member 18/19
VKTESRDKAQGVKEETSIGKLSLVDLAGSERAGGQKGTRQIEGAKINKSLLALGNCIQVLADSTSKNIFVPYRESKLTRLLKESLGGNCRTALIVNISPFSANWEETHNSLVYANRAKNIKNSATRNVLAC